MAKSACSLRADLPQLFHSLTSYPGIIITGLVTVGTGLVILRKYFAGAMCDSTAKLTGKTVIITGANTGIGKETAIDLAKRHAKVILACRNPDRGREAESEIRRKSRSNDVIYRHLDLASLASVRHFAEGILAEESHIDILINNAGIFVCPQWKTEDGFEMQFGVNHLGHFLLTKLLLERLKEAPSARIITVTSRLYKRIDGINFDDINNEQNYDPWNAYYHSKLANVLFTRALATRLEGTRVTANCLHPGVVWTDVTRHVENNSTFFEKLLMLPLVFGFKTPYQGAQTTIYCAVSEECAHVSGQYFSECKIEKLATAAAKDNDAAERLWTLSEELVKPNDSNT